MTDATTQQPHRRRVSRVERYGVAVATILLALWLRLGLTPVAGDHSPFLPLYLAVALSAWYGGLGPGLLTTLLGGILGDYLFAAPRYTLFPRTLDAGLQFFTFVSGGALVSWLTESLHRSRRLADERAAELEAVIESVPDGIYFGTLHGITRCNRKAMEMLGAASLADLRQRIGELGARFNVRWPDGTLIPEPELQFVRALRGETVFEEVVARRADTGEDVSIRSTAAPVIVDGRIIGAVAVNADMTAQKRTEEVLRATEARLNRMSAQAPCLLWSAEVEDRGCELLHWNMKLADPEAAQRFFPLNIRSGDEYQGAWYFSRLAEDRHRTDALGAAEIRAGRSYRQEFRCRRGDGDIRWFREDVQVETLAPGRWQVAGVITDITEPKSLEEALQQSHALLAQRADRLADADRAKDEFLAMLAHELRNPLGAMSNAVQLLKQLGLPDQRMERAQEIIERQVEHQRRMLDDLLDVSRVARGKITLHHVSLDLTRLVRDVAEDHRHNLEAGRLTLTLDLPDAPVWVSGDPTRLAQIAGNLLQNAGKFTDPGGEVTVTLKAIRQESTRRHGDTESDRENSGKERSSETGEHALLIEPDSLSFLSVSPSLRVDSHVAILTVTDTGVGIEPELLPRLFESFIQGEQSQKRGRVGLGLGLALVKGLVELHAGTVSAESDGPGRGARFTVSLPLAPQIPGSELPPSTSTHERGAWRVLVVEDNRDAAESLRDLLELVGCTVEVAASGPEALAAVPRFRPEIVLCDLGLPGMDGYEVAAELRRHSVTRDATLIAVSGYGQEEDRRRSQAAGFDRHLTKPIDFAELQQLLELPPGELTESWRHGDDGASAA